MDYERGLTRLKQLVYYTDQYEEFLIHEHRLRENLDQERLYGPNEQRRSDRAQIVANLNRLADQVGTNFNDLCLIKETSQYKYSPRRDTQEKQQNSNSSSVSLQNRIPISQRSKAYIGFSRQDKRYLNELHVHLDQHVRKGTIDYWDSTKIVPGANWHYETVKALNAAKVAILLVSADFLVSDPITKEELPVLLKAANNEGTVILCVILRPCAFQDSELAQFQPINMTPLSKMSQDRREEVWNSISIQIRDILQVGP